LLVFCFVLKHKVLENDIVEEQRLQYWVRVALGKHWRVNILGGKDHRAPNNGK
jgi:hypothetical protein